jgi:hypothetical protein
MLPQTGHRLFTNPKQKPCRTLLDCLGLFLIFNFYDYGKFFGFAQQFRLMREILLRQDDQRLFAMALAGDGPPEQARLG